MIYKIVKKQKSDLKSYSSYSFDCIEYLNISSLYFQDEERGVPFWQCPGVQIIGGILLPTEKDEVSKLLRWEWYTQASIELREHISYES